MKTYIFVENMWVQTLRLFCAPCFLVRGVCLSTTIDKLRWMEVISMIVKYWIILSISQYLNMEKKLMWVRRQRFCAEYLQIWSNSPFVEHFFAFQTKNIFKPSKNEELINVVLENYSLQQNVLVFCGGQYISYFKSQVQVWAKILKWHFMAPDI